MQQLFMKHRADPPISNNLPPLTGALSWSRGLLERVSPPMSKIKEFDKKVGIRLPGCLPAVPVVCARDSFSGVRGKCTQGAENVDVEQLLYPLYLGIADAPRSRVLPSGMGAPPRLSRFLSCI